MVISSKADIDGDDAVHALGTTEAARALILCAVGGPARFGDAATVSASQGVDLPTDVPVTIRASEADRTDYIRLGQVACYVPTGTTLTIAYGL